MPDDDHRPVPGRPTVRGERVWLRPIDEADLVAHCDAVCEHEPGSWAGFPGALGMRQVRQWDEPVLERWDLNQAAAADEEKT